MPHLLNFILFLCLPRFLQLGKLQNFYFSFLYPIMLLLVIFKRVYYLCIEFLRKLLFLIRFYLSIKARINYITSFPFLRVDVLLQQLFEYTKRRFLELLVKVYYKEKDICVQLSRGLRIKRSCKGNLKRKQFLNVRQHQAISI